MESVAVLKMKMAAMTWSSQAKDSTIVSLNQQLQTALVTMKRVQSKLSSVTSRNVELEKELQATLVREKDLLRDIESSKLRHRMFLEDVKTLHQREMNDQKCQHEKEIQRLKLLQQTLEDAEERLCVQLGDLEVESMEQERSFRANLATLSSRLAEREQELASVLSQVQAFDQRT